MLDFLADSPRAAPRPATWSFATAFPWLFAGEALHRLALHALAGGDHALALALFDRAGQAYRREGVVERLARLRVHELMARVRAAEAGASGTPVERQALVLEAERRLARLGRIERLDPPFAEVDARALLGAWCGASPGRERPAAAA